MKTTSVFDIIGPRMVGPSSSHTAGAARIGLMANKLASGSIDKAHITLYGSFAQTGRGHGTDKAIAAGLLGVEPNNASLRYAMLLAEGAGASITISYSSDECEHPNTARIEFETKQGKKYSILGQSIGGGNIKIVEVNGMDVEFGGNYPTLIVFYNDVPGVITKVTSLLAKEGINVAFMKVFRSARRMNACMIIETDAPIDDALLQQINECDPTIGEVCSI